MKKMRTKLSSEKGETILETLVALLIIVLAISFLTGAIAKSSKITADIKKINESGFSYTPDSSAETVVSVSENGVVGKTINVTRYGVKQYEGSENSYYYYEP